MQDTGAKLKPRPNVHERRCKKRNARGLGKALPLQMLDCSRDRCERQFETHTGKVDHEVRATVSGDRRDLQLSTSSMTTTKVAAQCSTILGSAPRVGRRQEEESTTNPMRTESIETNPPFACPEDTHEENVDQHDVVPSSPQRCAPDDMVASPQIR